MDADAGVRTVSGMDEDGSYIELEIPKKYSNWNGIVLADAERYVFSGAELVEVIDQMHDEPRQDYPMQREEPEKWQADMNYLDQSEVGLSGR